MNHAYRTNQKPTDIAARRAPRALYPLRNISLSLVMAASVGAVTLATDTGCGASQGQIADTVLAGEQLAACIIGSVLGGITDPLALAQRCGGALPAVIADVISDFETKQVSAQNDVAADAGSAPPDSDAGATLRGLSLRKLSDREQTLLDTAKKNAVTMLAASKKR